VSWQVKKKIRSRVGLQGPNKKDRISVIEQTCILRCWVKVWGRSVKQESRSYIRSAEGREHFSIIESMVRLEMVCQMASGVRADSKDTASIRKRKHRSKSCCDLGYCEDCLAYDIFTVAPRTHVDGWLPCLGIKSLRETRSSRRGEPKGYWQCGLYFFNYRFKCSRWRR
jgi:hypothetical protein